MGHLIGGHGYKSLDLRYCNKSEIKNEILIKEMINHKLLTVKASQNIVRILPPLILEEKHVDEAILKIHKAFKNLK